MSIPNPPNPPNPTAIINGILALGILLVLASMAGIFATWLLIDRVARAAPPKLEEAHMWERPVSAGFPPTESGARPSPVD